MNDFSENKLILSGPPVILKIKRERERERERERKREREKERKREREKERKIRLTNVDIWTKISKVCLKNSRI